MAATIWGMPKHPKVPVKLTDAKGVTKVGGVYKAGQRVRVPSGKRSRSV